MSQLARTPQRHACMHVFARRLPASKWGCTGDLIEYFKVRLKTVSPHIICNVTFRLLLAFLPSLHLSLHPSLKHSETRLTHTPLSHLTCPAYIARVQPLHLFCRCQRFRNSRRGGLAGLHRAAVAHRPGQQGRRKDGTSRGRRESARVEELSLCEAISSRCMTKVG